MSKTIAVKAEAFRKAIAINEKYLNIAFDALVEAAKDNTPDKTLIFLLCSYVNALKTPIAIIASLLKKEIDGTVVVNTPESVSIRSYMKVLRFYKNEISTNFQLSMELH